jgi:hypothetical protein
MRRVKDYIETFKNCFDEYEPMICMFYTYDEFSDYMDELSIDESEHGKIWEKTVERFELKAFADCENAMIGEIENVIEQVAK